MGALGEAGRGTEEGQSQTEVLLREIAENMAILRARIQETQPAEDDLWGRNKLEIRREGLCFGQARPTFRRHRDRWADFAAWFCRARTNYGVDDDQAKQGLFSAVEGAQSRLVIAGMDPDCQAMRDISFGEYLQQMGEKFRPAAESIQMKEEYLNRTQRAEEDVQSYVGEKTELFWAAFLHASQREWSRCWMETAEGLCNRYVRNQMMASEPCDAEDFVRRAVRAVQRGGAGSISVTAPKEETDWSRCPGRLRWVRRRWRNGSARGGVPPGKRGGDRGGRGPPEGARRPKGFTNCRERGEVQRSAASARSRRPKRRRRSRWGREGQGGATATRVEPGRWGRGRRNSPIRVLDSGGRIQAQHLRLCTSEGLQENNNRQDVGR